MSGCSQLPYPVSVPGIGIRAPEELVSQKGLGLDHRFSCGLFNLKASRSPCPCVQLMHVSFPLI